MRIVRQLGGRLRNFGSLKLLFAGIVFVAAMGAREGERSLAGRADEAVLEARMRRAVADLARREAAIVTMARQREAALGAALSTVPAAASPMEGAAFVSGVVEDISGAHDLVVESLQAAADSAFVDGYATVAVDVVATGTARALLSAVSRIERIGLRLRGISVQPLPTSEDEEPLLRSELHVAGLVRRVAPE